MQRRFCGFMCSRKWVANHRSDSWKQKASLAKQGQNNPMFGVSLRHPNSLANLNRQGAKGKIQTVGANQKRSESLKGIKRSQETIDKTKKTKIEKGIWHKPDDSHYVEFKKYRRKVYYWTSKNDLTTLENYDRRGLLDFHLDHKYSITEGFKHGVPPKIIGSIQNLHFMPYNENVSKGTKCSITLEELYALFNSGH
jgi:hypothetical protein